MKRFLALVSLVCSLCALSCGYTMTSGTNVSGPRGPGSDPNTLPVLIHIKTVQNQLVPPRPGLEYQFTERLKDEVVHDRQFELSPASRAAAKLEISLTKFEEIDAVRDFRDVPTEIALFVSAEIRVTQNGKVRRGSVRASSDYALRPGESRNTGLERLWRELAYRVMDFVSDYQWPEEEVYPQKSAPEESKPN